MEHIYKALARLAVATWENWDDQSFGRNFDPMEKIAKLAFEFDLKSPIDAILPDCLRALVLFFMDNPGDMTLDQIVDLCKQYAETV